MEERNRWIELIKRIRVELDVSLREAELIALRRSEWRRWVERQINDDMLCRRAALRHIRQNGTGSLIEVQDGRLQIREATLDVAQG